MHLVCNYYFQIDQANVSKETKQFTYKDGSQFVFMDLVLSVYISSTMSELGQDLL